MDLSGKTILSLKFVTLKFIDRFDFCQTSSIFLGKSLSSRPNATLKVFATEIFLNLANSPNMQPTNSDPKLHVNSNELKTQRLVRCLQRLLQDSTDYKDEIGKITLHARVSVILCLPFVGSNSINQRFCTHIESVMDGRCTCCNSIAFLTIIHLGNSRIHYRLVFPHLAFTFDNE